MLGMIEFAKSVGSLERNFNTLVREILNRGGKVYLTDKDNKDFVIKIDREFNIQFFVPIEKGATNEIH